MATLVVVLVCMLLMSSCESRPKSGVNDATGVPSRRKLVEITPIKVDPESKTLAYILAQADVAKELSKLFPNVHPSRGDASDGFWLSQGDLDYLSRVDMRLLDDDDHIDHFDILDDIHLFDDVIEERGRKHRGRHRQHGDVRPGYGDVRPGYGDVRLGYGDVRPGYGDVRPGYGDVRARYGDVRSGHGDVRPGHGDVRPGYGDVRPGHGDVRPGHGDVRPGYGDVRPGYSEVKPGYSEVKPGYSEVKPGHADVRPGYGNVRPGYGNVRPGYGNVRPEHGDVKAGNRDRLPPHHLQHPVTVQMKPKGHLNDHIYPDYKTNNEVTNTGAVAGGTMYGGDSHLGILDVPPPPLGYSIPERQHSDTTDLYLKHLHDQYDTDSVSYTTDDSRSTDSESRDSESNDSESNDSELTDNESTDNGSTDIESTDSETTDIELNDSESTDNVLTDSKSKDSELADIESTDSESTDNVSTEIKSNDSESTYIEDKSMSLTSSEERVTDRDDIYDILLESVYEMVDDGVTQAGTVEDDVTQEGTVEDDVTQAGSVEDDVTQAGTLDDGHGDDLLLQSLVYRGDRPHEPESDILTAGDRPEDESESDIFTEGDRPDEPESDILTRGDGQESNKLTAGDRPDEPEGDILTGGDRPDGPEGDVLRGGERPGGLEGKVSCRVEPTTSAALNSDHTDLLDEDVVDDTLEYLTVVEGSNIGSRIDSTYIVSDGSVSGATTHPSIPHNYYHLSFVFNK